MAAGFRDQERRGDRRHWHGAPRQATLGAGGSQAATGSDSALLLIDVQNDFCPGGNLAVESGNEVVPVINRIMPSFSRVVATQDWHPPDHVSFASSHPGRRPLDVVEADGIEQVLWPEHCVQGTRGAELNPRLDPGRIGLLLQGAADEELWQLHALEIATDYCVLPSALDARRLGFRVTLVRDACRGVNFPRGSVE